MIDNIDKRIIIHFSKDIDVTKDLYKDISNQIGISEEELIQRLTKLKQNEYLRRLGPIIRHTKSGFLYNGMAVWNVDEENLEKIINKAKTIKNISHIYERERCDGWNYNFYTMIHGQCKYDVEKTVKDLSDYINIIDYKILYTQYEWKKTSPNLEIMLS